MNNTDWIVKRGGRPYDPDAIKPEFKSRDRDTYIRLYVKIPHFGAPETDEAEARRVARAMCVSVDARTEVFLIDEDWKDDPPARWVDPNKGRVRD